MSKSTSINKDLVIKNSTMESLSTGIIADPLHNKPISTFELNLLSSDIQADYLVIKIDGVIKGSIYIK
jgi:hypothetical protein